MYTDRHNHVDTRTGTYTDTTHLFENISRCVAELNIVEDIASLQCLYKLTANNKIVYLTRWSTVSFARF